jgi:hypothetical protein
MSTACPSVQPFMAAISGKKQHLSAARELNEAQRSLTVQSHTVRSSEVESPLPQPVKSAAAMTCLCSLEAQKDQKQKGRNWVRQAA